MNRERIQQRYNAHQHSNRPSQMTDGQLTAELDDVVQIIAGASNVEWTGLQEIDAGKAYLLIMSEIRRRLSQHTIIPTNAEQQPDAAHNEP